MSQLRTGCERRRRDSIPTTRSGRTIQACSTEADVTLMCWGRNNYGQVGDGTYGTDRDVPTAVNVGGVVHKLAAGKEHTCASIDSGTTLKCWGHGSFRDAQLWSA